MTWDCHFSRVYVWDEENNRILSRLLIIRRTTTASGEYEYKYSFINANLEQYTEKGIAYMQTQRFFVEHCIKENKQLLGMDKYQTRKWLAWHHQIALNIFIVYLYSERKVALF